ncbi:chorismate mutase family protein [Bacillus swezeyi]|uniref:chorismate mutase family protein n=1 Tax=Bacillus swezeyi TaxID=1925020 RepID=UPI002E1DC5A3|nr:chorismate mutase family protein [Bacillus swezeyi]
MLSEIDKGLEGLRVKLDSIDEQLLDTLKARLECCIRIGLYKREYNIPMMQPHRINFVQERAARYADENGLSKEFLRNLYELIISETCRVEDIVIDNSENRRQEISSSLVDQKRKREELFNGGRDTNTSN